MSSIIEQITNRKLVSALTNKLQDETNHLNLVLDINNAYKNDNLSLKKENLALKSELERLFGRVDELISDIEALKSRLNPEEEKQ